MEKELFIAFYVMYQHFEERFSNEYWDWIKLFRRVIIFNLWFENELDKARHLSSIPVK